MVGRTATVNVEGSQETKTLERSCPQGSRLGPTLWKVAIKKIFGLERQNCKIIAYADDIVVLANGSRWETAVKRCEESIDTLKEWASHRGLQFSMSKTQVVTLKGGLKPGARMHFGSHGDVLSTVDTASYLGIKIDYKRNYWAQICSIADKSTELYKRLKAMTSANWGMSTCIARTIYNAVFLPRCWYGVWAWEKGLHTLKAIAKLESIQRVPLLSMTAAYKTTSTHALQIIAGVLPLDLELKLQAHKQRYKMGLISKDELDQVQREIVNIWQRRWDESAKGRWTWRLMPSVQQRLNVSFSPDHYTTQMLSGHGDFMGKLREFKLVSCGRCRCNEGTETVEHLFLRCKRTKEMRSELKIKLEKEGINWPPYDGELLRCKAAYIAAFCTFSNKALTRRTDR